MSIVPVQSGFDRAPVRRTPWLLAGVLLAACSTLQAAIIRVGQPGEPGCDQPSLQAAINAAAAAPGLDIIRVSAGTYIGQLLLINDSDQLAIEGGYLSCSTPVANAGTTILSAQGTPGGSVLSHHGSGRLTLSDLSITAGDASAGGGVYSSGAAPLTLQRVQLYNNRANAGGGLAVVGASGPLKEVNLLGVAFTSNVAQSIGGGIYAVNAHVRITGDSPNQFLANWAHGAHPVLGGGAIYANNSTVFIHSLPPVLGEFMDSNLATQGSGGAIAFIGTGPGWYNLTMMNRNGSQPLRIANNGAATGAAVSMQAGNGTGTIHVGGTLYDVIIEDNQGSQNIIHIDAYNTGHHTTASLTLMPSTVGMVAPRCPASLRCNRIDNNSSALTTVWVSSGGGSGHAAFSMHRGLMLDNYSPDGNLIGGTGRIYIDNSVLAGNSLANANLIGGIGNEIQIQNSTIANNFLGLDHVFASALPGASLTVHNSIVFQPGKQFHSVSSPVLVNLRNLLVNGDHGLDNLFPRNIQNTQDPSFINPGQGDFRPQPWSQAINRWSPGGGVQVPSVDLLGGTRPADPPGTPTPYDFGAYEYGAVVDSVFLGNFDG